MRVPKFLFLFVAIGLCAYGQERQNPYAAEGTAQDMGHNDSLRQLRLDADQLANSARTAVEFCTVAELYKRLGDPGARRFYEKAIDADPEEPAYELFYADYFRLYRGAGQRPLFPETEKHLFAAKEKLDRIKRDPAKTCAWCVATAERLQRSLTSLYERDGFQLASRGSSAEPSSSVERRPMLFLSPGMRWERSTADFDRPSDIRDLTSAALFSQNCLPPPLGRLCRSLTHEELFGMARVVTPLEGDGRLRFRYGSAPVVDVFASGRHTVDAQVTNFFKPDEFDNLNLIDFGAKVEKPFVIAGTTDAVVSFTFTHVDREGLIEFHATAEERVNQYEAYGAISHYLGPDRLNLSYTYVRQDIDPTPYLERRYRELMGGTIIYQLFRPLPLPGRDINSGLGRHFETRGVDLLAGVLSDNEQFRSSGQPDVSITRRDYFVGIAARGLGRIDTTVQPTLYTSQVSNDRSQNNSQLRIAGNVLIRLLDEERTAGMPSQRFMGLPVGFVQVVLPFHWDVPREGLESFRSRAVGGEIWTKLFSDRPIGVTVLVVGGYSRQWFPVLGKDLDLARVGITVGF
jgi:hypothetical protein